VNTTALGDGPAPRGRDEAGELRVGYLVPVDPEAADGDLVCGPLFRALVVVAHRERAALDPHHPGMRTVTFGQAGIAVAQSGRRTLARLQDARKDQEDGHARKHHGAACDTDKA
jgi:hypothetical protein